MRQFLWLMPLLVVLPAFGAGDDPPKKDGPPAEQFKALMEEVKKAQNDTRKKFQDAKTDAERQKVAEEFGNRFAPRVLALIEKAPKEDFAAEGAFFILGTTPNSPEGAKAIELLAKNQPEKLGQIAQETLAESSAPAAEKLLRQIQGKVGDHHQVQAQVTLALAQHLKNRWSTAETTDPAEAKKLAAAADEVYTELEKKFADVKPAVEAAKGDIFELRHLAVGKSAPDITGEDADGKAFKLSDYKGKVVVLDFWANW